jgi:hypothetical protein
MQKIAEMFAQGDFSLPMFIHETVPPGVEVMKRLKDQIAYTAENTVKGTQVRIVTGSPEALEAVHEFLRFQIKDQRTNDPLAIQCWKLQSKAGCGAWNVLQRFRRLHRIHL